MQKQKNLTNLIDLDVLVTVMRLAFFILDTKDFNLRISYIQILKHLSFASFISIDRIKQALDTLINVPFDIDGLDKAPIILKANFQDKTETVTIYFHPKVFLALKRGYFFDGLDYMPLQTVNKEDREKAIV